MEQLAQYHAQAGGRTSFCFGCDRGQGVIFRVSDFLSG